MTTGRTRAEQKRHTRALIVAAARRDLALHGRSGLAVREIAREAGIVPTAFYRHFESADELAEELAAESARSFVEMVDALDAPEDAAVLAGRWPEQVVQRAAEDLAGWAVFVRGLVDGGGAEAEAVRTARRRLGIVLGRSAFASAATGERVDAAADLVVTELVRLLAEVAGGSAPEATAAAGRARLELVAAGLSG